jgi:hypothetical protein
MGVVCAGPGAGARAERGSFIASSEFPYHEAGERALAWRPVAVATIASAPLKSGSSWEDGASVRVFTPNCCEPCRIDASFEPSARPVRINAESQSTMMNFMRRYGWYVFLIAIVVYFVDDYATNWHDHGHEKKLYIILENLIEDIVVFLFTILVRAWQNRSVPQLHVQCPKCNFNWVMHPRQKILFCPRCGAPEPP